MMHIAAFMFVFVFDVWCLHVFLYYSIYVPLVEYRCSSLKGALFVA